MNEGAENTAKMNKLVELKSLSVADPFDKSKMLIKDVNWTVFAGEFWVLGGLGGTGKTALLNTIAGIQKPVSGEVILFNKNIFNITEPELAHLRLRAGFIFESGGCLFQDMTVLENIILPYRYHTECSYEVAVEKAKTVIEFFEISNFADCLPSRIPRYIAPRVGLARCIILEPDLLFFDDPVKNLDIVQRKWWNTTLEKLWSGCLPPGGKPISIVVAVSDINPWLKDGRYFAIIHQNECRIIKNKDIQLLNIETSWAESNKRENA